MTCPQSPSPRAFSGHQAVLEVWGWWIPKLPAQWDSWLPGPQLGTGGGLCCLHWLCPEAQSLHSLLPQETCLWCLYSARGPTVLSIGVGGCSEGLSSGVLATLAQGASRVPLLSP